MEISATLIIIVLTCIISLIALNQEGLMEDLAMWPYYIRQKKQFYRFLTNGFVHANYMHLFFNMLSLYYMGRVAEQVFAIFYTSPYVFPAYYALAIIVSTIPYYFRHYKDPNRLAVGASGAVSACIFTIMLVQPWAQIYLFFFPMPIVVYGIVFLGLSAYLASRDTGYGGIGHGVHFWGAVFGLVFPILLQPSLLTYFITQLLSPFR
ncbi:Rhomboid family protein [Chitinophaga costaii]|uniref:Rhomboid family protein n=1 Tax=Chitinophaga costaii TaxID=1335309 RepID=A0A1C4G3M7_9BACT|nr:rhomboid family intramembrane serine protease [Chitinophaga costaii]PUZ20985.1 rhomboid family intramembrane serine protease [Chitinophaga costaii]SCC62790.1 Rhomboid family protein [Chitinophaga costaii]